MFKCTTHWTANDKQGFEHLTHPFIAVLHQELELVWQLLCQTSLLMTQQPTVHWL